MVKRKILDSTLTACIFVAALAAVLLLSGKYVTAVASDPKVVEAAKKEKGELLAFIVTRVETAQILADRFRAKYPFIRRVNLQRGDSLRMLEWALSEYRGVGIRSICSR